MSKTDKILAEIKCLRALVNTFNESKTLIISSSTTSGSVVLSFEEEDLDKSQDIMNVIENKLEALEEEFRILSTK